MDYILKKCLWFTAKVQIGQATFSTSDLNDFYDPWVDQTKLIACQI